MPRQVILGEDEFADSLADHLKKHKHAGDAEEPAVCKQTVT